MMALLFDEDYEDGLVRVTEDSMYKTYEHEVMVEVMVFVSLSL